MKHALLLLFFVPLTIWGQSFDGTWYSSFEVMGMPMRMQLTISQSKNTVKINNPDLMEMPPLNCEKVSMKSDTISFEWTAGGLSYMGVLSNRSISGTMRQNGISWQAIFTRELREAVVLNRPQEPSGPFPYRSDSLQIQNGEISLGATLVLPDNFDATTPIVILVSGSGQQNRDSELMGHKPFWVIADYLARKGIASIRFDDRGTGTSSANASASLEDFASDVEAIARFLRKERKYKKNPLGSIGHSEGGMHTLIAATNYTTFDFTIQLATVGTSGRNVLVQQQYDIPKAAGAPEELCKWQQELYAGMVDIIDQYPQTEAADTLVSFLGNAWDTAPNSFDKTTSTRLQFIFANSSFMNNTWMRQFLAFKTADYLEQIEIPLLAIHAGKDIQVAPESNSKGFDAYPQAETHILSGLNHLFQPCDRCTVDEYGEIETTISSDALHIMATWILGLQ